MAQATRDGENSGGGLPTGVVTFLLTDVVGSTATWDRDPTGMAEALHRHDELVAAKVAHCGGHLVKSKGEGDSTFNVFQRASDAVRAAIEVQHALSAEPWPAGINLQVRAALHTGAALERGGDYYGGTVNRAARLRSIARAAEILASESTASLVTDELPEGAVLTDRGVHTLRDLTRPERVFAVSGAGLPDLGAPEPATSGDRLQVPLPRRLAARTPFGYVGREAEQARIRQHLADAIDGDGPRLVIVSGEAGIGKTQLVCEIAAAAVEAGAAVLYGRCPEDGGPAYGPMARVLEAIVAAAPAHVVAPHGDALAPLVPSLASDSQEASAGAADPVAERYQLFQAVTGLLEATSTLSPLLLVLDDLHWADGPTLSLLRHVVTHPTRFPVLVVATDRDERLDGSPEHDDALAMLTREPNVDRVSLTGLSPAELEELVRRAAGDELDDEAVALAEGLFRETDGHPFFTVELLVHLVESGYLSEAGGTWQVGGDLDPTQLPRSVRDVVERRVERLGPEATRALRAGSVIGQVFDLELLAGVLDADAEAVLGMLEDAVGAALIKETAPERFTFTHGLVRSALLAGLSPTRRAGLHRRVAESIEARGAHDNALGELALHWEAAGRDEDLVRALDAARRAGEHALERLGPDDAVTWLSRAADLAARTDADEHLRCSVQVRLGDAQRQAGQGEYRTTLLDAAQTAARIQADALLVEAALANDRGFQSASTQVDHERVAVLEQALLRVAPEADHDRARLLATLANELSYSPTDGERRASLAEEAVRLARGTGDPRALAAAVHRGLLPVLSPETLPTRLAWSRDAEAAAAEVDDPVLIFSTAVSAASTHVDAFLVREAERRREAFVELGDRLGQPLLRWTARWSGVQILTLQGRLDEAEATMDEGMALGTAAGEADALQIYAANLVGVRYAQGRIGELRELLAGVVADMSDVVGYRLLLALAHADDGALDDAAALYVPLAEAGFEDIPRDPGWPMLLGACAEIVTLLPDVPGTERLYELLVPAREQTAAVTAMCLGSLGRQAGQVAIALGRHDEAADHLVWVAAHAEKEGAAVELARTWLAQASLARATGAPAPEVVAGASRARAEAERVGAAGVARRAAALLDDVGG